MMAYPSLPCVKGGGLRSKTEGLLKAKNYSQTIPQSPAVTAPFTQGSLKCAVPLLMVGSGFCPIWRDGHPRAMLAPDASVGKAEFFQPPVAEFSKNKLLFSNAECGIIET